MRVSPSRSLLVAAAGLGIAAACNQILGNRSPDVADGPDATAPPASQPDGGVVVAADGAVGCAAGLKSCSGACVSRSPQNGCAAADCAPCTIDHAEVGCSGTGACFLAACQAGFFDCDNDASNGCETDLGDPEHCGKCNGTCSTVCSPKDGGFSCESSCALPTVECQAGSGRCNDLTTDPDNCGACGNPCRGAEHGAALCKNSLCRIVCDVGYNDCVTPGVCVPDTDAVCGTACHCLATVNRTTVQAHHCEHGTCFITCTSGRTDSNGDPSDGCECQGASCPQ